MNVTEALNLIKQVMERKAEIEGVKAFNVNVPDDMQVQYSRGFKYAVDEMSNFIDDILVVLND